MDGPPGRGTTRAPSGIDTNFDPLTRIRNCAQGAEGRCPGPGYWYPQGLKSGIIRGVAGACSAGGCQASGSAGVASAIPEAGRLWPGRSRRGDSAVAPPVAARFPADGIEGTDGRRLSARPRYSTGT